MESRLCCRAFLVATAMLTLGVSACGEAADPSRVAVTTRDSAGVTIREIEGPPSPAGTFVVEPLYRHGFEEGDYAFQHVVFGSLQASGGAVVADMGSSDVVRLDSLGRSAVLLRKGQGPTEVRGVMGVRVLGPDTVWVDDDDNGKLMLMHGGELAESVSTLGSFELSSGLRLLGVAEDGRLLMGPSAFRQIEFEGPWRQAHMVALDPWTLVADTLGAYDHAAEQLEDAVNPYSPFGMLTVAGGRFVHARTDRPELVWRGADGSVRRILRWEPALEYPGPELWEEFEAFLREDYRRVNPRHTEAQLVAGIRRVLATFRIDPEAPLPFFKSIMGDDAGGVWMEEYRPGDPPVRRFDVVSGEGEWLGTVFFPSPIRLLDVRGRVALGVVRDDFDVQGVAAYRVTFVPG